MTDRAIEASRRLDALLRQPLGAPMPELGGKRFAGDFSGAMGNLRQKVDSAISDAHRRIAAASTGLVTEISGGAAAIERAIQAEQEAVRKSYADMLGNNPPADEGGEAAKPPPTTPPNGSGGSA